MKLRRYGLEIAMRCQKLSGPAVQNLLEVRGVLLRGELIAARNNEAKDLLKRRRGRVGGAEVIIDEWQGWKPVRWTGEERGAKWGR